MALSGNFVSFQSVLESVYRKVGYQKIDVNEVIEVIGETLRLIGVLPSFKDVTTNGVNGNPAPIAVADFRTLLPADYVTIHAVRKVQLVDDVDDLGNPIQRINAFHPMTHATDIFYKSTFTQNKYGDITPGTYNANATAIVYQVTLVGSDGGLTISAIGNLTRNVTFSTYFAYNGTQSKVKESKVYNTSENPENVNSNQNSKPEKKKTEIPENALQLADLLATLHREKVDPGFKPSKTRIEAWARDIDRINRIDGREWESIEAVIRWAKADSFWSSNIIAGNKLRDQFEQLIAKMPHTSPPVEKVELERPHIAENKRDVVFYHPVDCPTCGMKIVKGEYKCWSCNTKNCDLPPDMIIAERAKDAKR